MSRNLWEAWTLSQKWGTRPSEMYGVREEIAAFCFDRAVTMFGQNVENEIHAATKDAKSDREANALAQRVLNYRLKEGKDKVSGFKDPAKSMSF